MVRGSCWSLTLGLLVACGGEAAPDSAARAGAGGAVSAGAAGASGASGSAGAAAGATGGTSAAGAAGAGPSSVPLIDTVDCGAKTKPPGTGVAPGGDLKKVTLTGANALCNDGSPGVLYIRAASSPTSAGQWVFHFQGGGECVGSDPACIERWCGRQASYDAAKMSSKFSPPGMPGNGILLRDPKNSFGDANQVFFYYCSSDNWASRKSDYTLDDTTKPGAKLRLHFRGRSIIEDAVQRLMTTEVVSDDGSQQLPKLATASLLLATGSSGGSGAVMANGDWLASLFDPAKTAVRLVLDASLFPQFDHVTNGKVRDAVRDQFIAQSGWLTSTDAHVDQSCASAHQGADLWQCDWNPHVRLNHLTTPFFQRADLGDPNASQSFEAAGASKMEFASWQRTTSMSVPDVVASAEEKSSIVRRPGIYSPACGQHVALTNNDWFFTATVKDSGGKPLSFHDALRAWVDGADVVAVDTVPPSLSACAKTNGATD